ncbi:hypothetical protein PBAT_23310 [Paenibacillus antarcticus]|uniref:Uncharacterized protein n=1 Tax=Paenibacillus antarcticus TaxID=253703 RepID=A0A162M8V9_9BACL|nr:hypothetical protein [Paenibacillus antarcticus]OAB40243.1 hypothetical protein PBAT_23310 [Paenibacillus antarcticus]
MYIVSIAIFIAIVCMMLPYLYMLFKETNMVRLEKFLIRQRNNPSLYLFYAIANKQDEVVESQINRLLAKYKDPNKQALYKAIYGAYLKNMTAVKNDVSLIQSIQFRIYYEAYVHIEEGNLELARDTAAKLSKTYMKSALLSEIELRTGNRQEAIDLARLALQKVSGLQRYIVYKNYERELPEALLKD